MIMIDIYVLNNVTMCPDSTLEADCTGVCHCQDGGECNDIDGQLI